jgi:hypothetical protein
LGPGKFKKLAGSLKDYKTWGYSARLQRKGLDFDLNNVFGALILNPKEGPAILQRVADALESMPKATPPA